MPATNFYPSPFTSFDVEVSPGITLHGVRSPSSGPPLLLLHGFPQTHIIWHKAAPALAAHYTLVIPDLRGYGASSKPPAPASNPADHSLYSKRAMGEDVSLLMHALGHPAYFVVGHDRGGRVAHQLAIDKPSEVKALMILDICPTLAMYGHTDQRFATAYWHWFFLIQPAPFPETVMLADPAAMIRKQVCGMHAGIEVFGEAAVDEYVRQMSDPAGVHAMCEDYRAAAVLDLEMQRKDRDDGRYIQCRTRALWGLHGVCEKMFKPVDEWGKVVKPGMLDEQGSKAVDCGHYIPEEKPAELVKEILDFLKQCQ